MKKSLFNLLIILFVALGFVACSDDDNGGTNVNGELNIVETAQGDNSFSTLVQALTDANLVTALEADGPFTVFAPTNEAFSNLPEGTLESLTTEQLSKILQFHVVSGAITSGSLSASQSVATLEGEELLVESAGGVVTINGYSTVENPDIEASNGIIHAIDEVLLPAGIREANIVDQADAAGSFTTLLSALDDTELTNTLKYKGDFTVFAPTDAAFAALPSGLLGSLSTEQLTEILTYHVLSGEVFSADLEAEQAPATLNGEELFVTSGENGVFVNGSSEVATPDLDVSNGVIHVVNKVLLPDAYGTVVDAASKRYNFETLVQAVVDAGLAGALSNTDATFTVFAPTDDAFAKLPAGLLDGLTTEQLATILQYHVLPVEVASGDLEAEQAPASLTEESVYVTVNEGTVTVNNSATVLQADVATNNGTIHAIDEVILPNEFLNIVGIASKNYVLTTLVSLLSSNELTSTLEGETSFALFAPTNQAFTDAQSLIDTLTPEQVSDVLKYHVSGTTIDFFDGQTIITTQGEDISVSVDSEGNVTLNGSVNVTTVKLEGTNGVVHILDGVLVPPSMQN